MNAQARMSCPACGTRLVMSERQGIEIDYCPDCRGVWLDRGELDKIVQRSAPAAPAGGASFAPAPRGLRHHDHDDRRHHEGKRRKSFLEELFD